MRTSSSLDSFQSRGSAAVPSFKFGRTGPAAYAVSADGHTVRQWSAGSVCDDGWTVVCRGRSTLHLRLDTKLPRCSTSWWTTAASVTTTHHLGTTTLDRLFRPWHSFDSHSPAASRETTPLGGTHRKPFAPCIPTIGCCRPDLLDWDTLLVHPPPWPPPPPPPPLQESPQLRCSNLQGA